VFRVRLQDMPVLSLRNPLYCAEQSGPDSMPAVPLQNIYMKPSGMDVILERNVAGGVPNNASANPGEEVP
jgi:hypothetical protein